MTPTLAIKQPCVQSMILMGTAYGILAGALKQRCHLEAYKRKNNIEVVVRKIGRESLNFIELAEDRAK
jgi:hypothetical protein